MACDRIFFLKVPCRGLLTLMVIFRAWKDTTRVLVFRKEKAALEGRFHEKGMWANEGFCARQGLCRGFGQQSQWRTWAAQLESSYFHTASVPPLTKGLLFPFILEANRIGTLLDCRGFLVTLVMMMPRSGLT